MRMLELSSVASLSSFQMQSMMAALHAAIMLCICFLLGLRYQVNSTFFGFKPTETHAILTGTQPS